MMYPGNEENLGERQCVVEKEREVKERKKLSIYRRVQGERSKVRRMVTRAWPWK